MQLILIAAMAKNRVIGKEGAMPWHLPADFAYFKRMTANHPMIMGRTTFDSLPHVLPGREHFVVTRKINWQHPGCTAFASIEAALQFASDRPLVMVIGGMQIYEQTLAIADQVLLTEIDHSFEGDRYFPPLPPKQWKETHRETHAADQKNKYRYAFVRYERIDSHFAST